jgi:hypothetical protein
MIVGTNQYGAYAIPAAPPGPPVPPATTLEACKVANWVGHPCALL